MNKYQRLASTYKYYSYVNQYSPAFLRRYQSERYYGLGRSGAYSTLVLKMAADHIGYEEDLSVRYRVPPVIVNFCYRLAWLWAVLPTILIMGYLGQMTKLFTPHQYYYAGKPSDEPQNPTRYESMYWIQKPARMMN